MSSPFPGMNPYVERSGIYRDFHTTMINAIRRQINADLPPGYVALTEERVVLAPLDRIINPDVFILRKPMPKPEPSGGVATRTPTPAYEIEPLDSIERQLYIEIRSGADWDEVITVIEILSPVNKRAGKMRGEYLRKQKRISNSETSLLEIDLVRGGTHTLLAPIADQMRENQWHYAVDLSAARRRGVVQYWPFTVRDALPIVPVPLKAPDADVILDLQAAFDSVYTEGLYDRLIDYRQEPPDPPFVGQDAVWVDRLLREKGLRPSEECPQENTEGSA